MERPFTLLILLLLIGQLANGQNKQPPGSLQPPLPVANRHRNPDYAESDSKQPDDSRRRVNRPKSSGEYAVPSWPNQSVRGAAAPGRMPFRMSTDGKALIIGPQRVEINNGEPAFGESSFRMGLFGGLIQ